MYLNQISNAKTVKFACRYSLKWLNKPMNNFTSGEIILFGGNAGIGKSTLSLQMAEDFARQKIPVHYLTTEQSLPELKAYIEHICLRNGRITQKVQDYLIIDKLDISNLSSYFSNFIGEEFPKVIIIDSLHSKGISSASTKMYSKIYDFFETAKQNNIMVIAIAHVTKDNKLRGPGDLLHNVDCIMDLRSPSITSLYKYLFIRKTRFGRLPTKPLIIEMNEKGKLIKSKHDVPVIGVAKGLVADTIVDCETRMLFPDYGCKASVNPPFLPTKKIKLLIKIAQHNLVSSMNSLSFDLEFCVPYKNCYHVSLDLPLVISLVGSYYQKKVPEDCLFIGELDLAGKILPVKQSTVEFLPEILDEYPGNIKNIYAAKWLVRILSEVLEPKFNCINVYGCENLKEVANHIWPDFDENV